MSIQTLRSISDTYVSQAAASATKYGASPRLALRAGGAGNAYPFLLPIGVPVGPDVTIVSASLHAFADGAWSGAQTLKAKRPTGKWSSGDLKYGTMPAVTAVGEASVAANAVPDNGELVLDITTIAQAWASGAPMYGLRLETTGTALRALHSANADGADAVRRPYLVIEWSAPPDQPVALNPDAGRQVSIARPTASWRYSDRAGGPMTAYEWQMNPTDAWGAPAYTSGVVTSSLPQHTLGVDVPNGATRFCRVRHRNEAGVWSVWSESEAFGRTPKAALSIDNPPAPPNNHVAESTPPIIWTFGGTQTRYQVLRPQHNNQSVVADDSGELPGTSSAHTLPRPLLFADGLELVKVRVWDDVDRAATPGDPPYVEAVREFSYQPSAGVPPVTNLSLSLDGCKPLVVVGFDRAEAADAYTIRRDTEVVAAKVPAGELFVSGSHYEFVDATAAPRVEHVWQVDAIVNDAASATSPSQPGMTEPQYVWLLDPDDPEWWIAMAGDDGGSWAMGEQSEMNEVRGSDRLILIAEALRGYEGTMAGGLFTDLPGLDGISAQELRDRVWSIKRRPTHIWRLVLSDLNIPVVLRNVVPTPTPNLDLDFSLSFEFYQQGELPWVP